MKLWFLLSLFSACCRLSGLISEGSEVTGSVGDDVILLCRLKPLPNDDKLLVKWERNETDVHTYRSRADYLDSQDECFKNRTRLFHSEMVYGNMSLKLLNVTEQDEGVYTCSVRNGSIPVKKEKITLKIVPKEQDSGRRVIPTSGLGGGTHENHLSTPAIIGIVVGAVIVIGIVIGIVIFVIRQRGQQQNNAVI